MGRPADHDAVRPGLPLYADQIAGGADVAVGDDGNLHRLLHVANDAPVGVSTVILFPGAAMDGNGIHPRRFGPLGHLHGVDVIGVPADAHLHRERKLYRPANSGENSLCQCRIPEQRRPGSAPHNFRRGTAHVKIDDVRRAEAFHIGGRLRRPLRRRAEKLQGQRPFLRHCLQHGEGRRAAKMDAQNAHHFGKDQRAAHLPGQNTVGSIRHPGHRSQKNGNGKLHRPDFHGVLASG